MATKEEMSKLLNEDYDKDVDPDEHSWEELNEMVDEVAEEQQEDEEEQKEDGDDEEDEQEEKETVDAESVSTNYRMNRNVKHNGAYYEKGEVYSLSPSVKKHFVQNGWAEPA